MDGRAFRSADQTREPEVFLDNRLPILVPEVYYDPRDFYHDDDPGSRARERLRRAGEQIMEGFGMSSERRQKPAVMEAVEAFDNRYDQRIDRILRRFGHADAESRRTAAEELAGVPLDDLREHSHVLAERLQHSDAAVRAACLHALGRLEPYVFERYSFELVVALGDPVMMHTASAMLERLPVDVLERHVERLAEHLESPELRVRRCATAALRRLRAAYLAPFREVLVQRLADRDDQVRHACRTMLGRLQCAY